MFGGASFQAKSLREPGTAGLPNEEQASSLSVFGSGTSSILTSRHFPLRQVLAIFSTIRRVDVAEGLRSEDLLVLSING